jgi:NTE family protein
MWGCVRVAKTLLAILACLTLLGACQTVPVAGVKKEPKIALVLGGGSARGFAHVGVIRALEQEKIPLNLIVGTSVGSLIGAIYAASPDSFQLEWTAFKIEKNDILDFSIIYSKLGPVQGARLESFVEQTAKVRLIEQTKIPFFPVATDLTTGESIILERGSLAKAVRASSAIPGIFVPVNFDNRMLVDGGVTNTLACDVARSKGADIVIGVNLQKDVRSQEMGTVVDIIGQSVNIVMHEATKSKLKYCDVVIEPDTKGVSLFDFSQKKALMEEGIKATTAAMPGIRKLLEKYR